MKTIEIDDELYQFIAAQTTTIGEDASEILRRILGFAPLVAESKDEKQPSPKAPDVKEVNVAIEPGSNIFDIVNREELAMQKGVVGRFLLILAALHRIHGEGFSCVLDIRGRNRLYFARSENELLGTGSSTNPKQIHDSGYWVITNSNTTKKKLMLTDVAFALGYTSEDAEKIRELL